MLLAAERLLELLQFELPRLGAGDAGGDVSSSQSAAMALRVLLNRERGGRQALYSQFDRLIAVLDEVLRSLPSTAAVLRGTVEAARSELLVAKQGSDLPALEAVWRKVLYQVEDIATRLRAASDVDAATRAQLIHLMASWEIDDLLGQAGDEPNASAAMPAHIDGALLAAYLRDRFADPELQVPSFRALPGGFGKQTFLFDAQGREFSGAFVMRRDFAHPLVDNDCHRIHNEYAVIRAVHQRGFPAPDALWLDTEHRLLPGGDFIIMRRSPGVSGGTVLRPNARIADDLAARLADILARLHALPPMDELGSLTESINRDLWALPTEQSVRHYLQGWLRLLQNTSHLPSPACMSLLGWLLDHLPAMHGRTALIHGDVGFHNFLIDDGRLTTVLDWEFAHLGDPAEDLASIRNNMGDMLDWDQFMRSYRAAGGDEIDMARVHFFQVWGHVRNAIASILAAQIFLERRADDIKFVITPHVYVPMFLGAAQALIKAGVPSK